MAQIWSQAKKFIQQLFTERDNRTGDLARVGWFIVLIWLLAVSTWWTVAMKHPFDLVQAAAAFGGYLGCYGGTLWVKRSSETGAPS